MFLTLFQTILLVASLFFVVIFIAATADGGGGGGKDDDMIEKIVVKNISLKYFFSFPPHDEIKKLGSSTVNSRSLDIR